MLRWVNARSCIFGWTIPGWRFYSFHISLMSLVCTWNHWPVNSLRIFQHTKIGQAQSHLKIIEVTSSESGRKGSQNFTWQSGSAFPFVHSYSTWLRVIGPIIESLSLLTNESRTCYANTPGKEGLYTQNNDWCQLNVGWIQTDWIVWCINKWRAGSICMMRKMGQHSVKLEKEWALRHLLQYQDLIKAFPFDLSQQELRYISTSLTLFSSNTMCFWQLFGTEK